MRNSKSPKFMKESRNSQLQISGSMPLPNENNRNIYLYKRNNGTNQNSGTVTNFTNKSLE